MEERSQEEGRNIMKRTLVISMLTFLGAFGCLEPELDADDMDSLTQGQAGLKGQYFKSINLTNPAFERVDSTISFDWGRGAPDTRVGVDDFSVRWTGYVQAKHSETYTFYTVGDDGIRLYVDNKLVVNDWSNHGARERSGTIALKAGQSYPIKLEYYESAGGAVAKLLWSSPSQAKQIIPATQLGTALPDSGSDSGGQSGGTVQNIALGKPTSQSSTAGSGVSSRAVDGNTSGRYSDGSVTHTDSENVPWWRVDLGGASSVGSVVIFNRTDSCCLERLSNFNVDYLDSSGKVIATRRFAGVAPAQTKIDLSAQGVHAVRVRLNGTNPLSLAEVQVFGGAAGGAVDEPDKGTKTIHKIEDLDSMAAFSFSIFGDHNGMAARNYDEFGDPSALGMSRLEKWIKANDKFAIGVGDHAIGNRKYWIWQTEKDAFWNNHFYPAVGDNCNETDYFYGKTGNQAEWGRGWVMFKALNKFFNRNTSVDKIVFRQPESTPVYSSKSKAEPNTLVPYKDQLVDYYVTRKQGKFNIHIVVVHYASPGVLDARSKNFMMNRLRSLSATRTNYDIIVVIAQRAEFLRSAQSAGHMTRAERDTVMRVADLVVCGDSHIYARQTMFDKDYDGKEALFMNSGAAYQTGALWGYLNVHVFDNPPRFSVQYIDVQFKNTRQLHVEPVRRSSVQKAQPEEAVSPVLKVVNGPRSRIDWKRFGI
jgi:hypothetical protein